MSEKLTEPVTTSYSDIASRLLEDKLLLTALELHNELIESGRELKALRDFFSDPGNFELQTQPSSLIARSGSQATLDSLDLTRFSEDGERSSDERVAVLEFELRKAKETINALRNNLTVATESETSTPVKKGGSQVVSNSIKPHEQRALNFLINEYLLLHGYKLTSITFADENENQDFEDWDDVGLNICKPVDLLTLYREGLKQTGQNSRCLGIQTDFVTKDKTSEDKINRELLELRSQVTSLTGQVSELLIENSLLNKSADQKDGFIEDSRKSVGSGSSKNSSDGNMPELFEMIDKNNGGSVHKIGSVNLDDNVSNNSSNAGGDWTNVTINTSELVDSDKKAGRERKFAQRLSDDGDFFNCQSSRRLPSSLRKELVDLCYVNPPKKLDQLLEIHLKNQSEIIDTIISTLSKSLLRITPNVILNKREEVIPLLVLTICLSQAISDRDKLLQQLFNLKKKPTDEERQEILTGMVTVARWCGESVAENEILPLCWEQLTHKHMERRLLVVETCNALIPHVSSPIRNSLMLSIMQQLLGDREERVRETVIRSISLIVALCDDSDKYRQVEELVITTLSDPSEIIAGNSVQILCPVLAKWALDIDRLHSDLIKQLLYKLNKVLKAGLLESQNKNDSSSNSVVRIIHTLDHLLPFVLVYVTHNKAVLSRIENDMTIQLNPSLLKLCTSLTNPCTFCDNSDNIALVFYEFDRYIDEDGTESWPALDWFLEIVLPDLLNNINHIEVTDHSVLQSIIDMFLHICETFGNSFTCKRINPLFQSHMQNLEQMLSNFNQYSPNLCIIPVYLVSVLSLCDNPEELSSILKRFVCALPLYGTPLDCLETTVTGLCRLNMQELVVACLWEGVMHQRPLVRAAAAALFSTIVGLCGDALLSTRVTPALVTLANDSDTLVRTAAVPALGSLITDCLLKEVNDKAYLQIQTCLLDVSSRENHALLRQLVVTLGYIVGACKSTFRDEIILPQLTSLASYTSQMSNQTRKVDMALALLEAFSNAIYCPAAKSNVSTILPGLKHLQVVVLENPSLSQHRDSISSMIKEVESRNDVGLVQSPTERTSSLRQDMNQGMEDMRNRVSKIFTKPPAIKQSNLPNLQNIFKKK